MDRSFILKEGEIFDKEIMDLLMIGEYRVKTIRLFCNKEFNIAPNIGMTDPTAMWFDNYVDLDIVDIKFYNGIYEYNMIPFGTPQELKTMTSLVTDDYEWQNPEYVSKIKKFEIILEHMNVYLVWDPGCDKPNRDHICGFVSNYFESYQELVDYVISNCNVSEKTAKKFLYELSDNCGEFTKNYKSSDNSNKFILSKGK